MGCWYFATTKSTIYLEICKKNYWAQEIICFPNYWHFAVTKFFFWEKIFLKKLFFLNCDYSKTKTDINAWSSALERGEQIL